MKALQNYEGPVLFLEADHYLAPDALHVLRLLDSTRHMHCAQCRVMTMGMYQPVVPGDLQAQKAVRVTWASNLHNMAMAYNRSTWLEIKRCASQFCQYDDYNWDWTLMHLSKAQCFGPQHLQTLVAVPPRALHFGQCGTHTKEKKGSCDPTATINRAFAIVHHFASRNAAQPFSPPIFRLSGSVQARCRLSISQRAGVHARKRTCSLSFKTKWWLGRPTRH